MKHIKLFENWAEELNVPEYLDPNWIPARGEGKNIFEFKTFAKRAQYINFFEKSEYGDRRVNAVSLSHYKDFWKKTPYIQVKLDQDYCKYKLEDCFDIPDSEFLDLRYNNIKSLNGLKSISTRHITIGFSKLENLKYHPAAKTLSIQNSPLISYFGIHHIGISSMKTNLCGEESYLGMNSLSSRYETNTEFHAEMFCNFKSRITKDTPLVDYKKFNPWHQVYYDPNDVENYDFLFNPFYMSSERFRERAHEELQDEDLGGIMRKEIIW